MQHTVDIGDRFRLACPPHYLWEVEGVTRDLEGLPHARLVRVDFPKESRMVATDTLKDKRFFEAVDDTARAAANSGIAPLRRLFSAFRFAN